MKNKIPEYTILSETHLKEAIKQYLRNGPFNLEYEDIELDFLYEDDAKNPNLGTWICEVEGTGSES
jgi:hypothetical protein